MASTAKGRLRLSLVIDGIGSGYGYGGHGRRLRLTPAFMARVTTIAIAVSMPITIDA